MKNKIIKRAGEVQKNGCYGTACNDCILNNVICSTDFLGDTPAEDSKILLSGFFIGMKFYEEEIDK